MPLICSKFSNTLAECHSYSHFKSQLFCGRVLANRLALDSQGRLVLRESGKIVLPFEHFANAVMLKHMSGPHGMHLSLEATVRSVCESYTIGRENFGMEKEFILEVVQSCPNPACRYYKSHMGSSGPSFMDAAFQSAVGTQPSVDFMQHLPQPQPPSASQAAVQSQPPSQPTPIVDITQVDNTVKQLQPSPQALPLIAQPPRAVANSAKMGQSQQQQITAAIIQQQNRAIAQQNLEKFGNLSAIEKQRVLQQLDKKQYEKSVSSKFDQSSNVPFERVTDVFIYYFSSCGKSKHPTKPFGE